MDSENKRIGKIGEDLAEKYLSSKNYNILFRNFRAKQYGEVDIIVIHPDNKTLVFVEVKTRIGNTFGEPEEAITKSKLREMKKMVDYYYNQNPDTKFSPQIDVIAISLFPNETLENLDHFENITSYTR